MIAFFVTQISHHHWSKTASTTVNCCAVTSFSRSVKHMESKIASRMPLDNWSPVRFSGDVVPKFPLGWCARGRLFWRLSVETRSACCRPDFSTNLCHCSKPGSRSAPRTTSRASPLVLEIKKNVANFGPSRSSHRMVHLVCHVKLVLQVCHSDRLLPILCSRHRLLQRYVHHADEVSRQKRPSSPIGAVPLSELVGHQGLGLHQPDARPRTDRTAGCSQFLMHRLVNCSCSSWIACSTDMATQTTRASKREFRYHESV